MCGVKILNLGWNSINGVACTALASLLRTSTIEELLLPWNGIDDEGALALFNVLGKSQLQRLDLSSNRIGHVAGAALPAFIWHANHDFVAQQLSLLQCHAKSVHLILLCASVAMHSEHWDFGCSFGALAHQI
jgi:Ran GTPase-activating protein (RanGAP) involved in mRNA processing and transport